jgi:nicotinamidase-related amidase
MLVQEVQEGVVGTTSRLPALADAAREVGLIAAVGALAGSARAAGVPVIHCTAESLPDEFGRNRNARLFAAARRKGLENASRSESVRPINEVYDPDADLVLPRLHGLSPLTGSHLDSLLRNQGVQTLIISGVSLNLAIPNLVFDAVNRSYQTVLASDAVVGVPVEYGEQVVEHSLALVATVLTSHEIAGFWAAVVA